jgi:hypothetical protein
MFAGADLVTIYLYFHSSVLYCSFSLVLLSLQETKKKSRKHPISSVSAHIMSFQRKIVHVDFSNFIIKQLLMYFKEDIIHIE